MYVDVWSHIAQRQRKVNKIEKLWKTRLVAKKPELIALVAYYKATNVVLKEALKAKVRVTALLWRVRK
jgi:hypothetical protein